MESKQKKKQSSASRAGFTYPEILCECGEPLPIHRNKNQSRWICRKCKKYNTSQALIKRQTDYYNAHERDRLRRKRTNQSLQKAEELNQKQKHISDFFISDPDERELEDVFAREFNPEEEPFPKCESCGFELGSTNCNVCCNEPNSSALRLHNLQIKFPIIFAPDGFKTERIRRMRNWNVYYLDQDRWTVEITPQSITYRSKGDWYCETHDQIQPLENQLGNCIANNLLSYFERNGFRIDHQFTIKHEIDNSDEEEIDWKAKWSEWLEETRTELNNNFKIHRCESEYWNIILKLRDRLDKTQGYSGPHPKPLFDACYGLLFAKYLVIAPSFSWMHDKKLSLPTQKFLKILQGKEEPNPSPDKSEEEITEYLNSRMATHNLSLNLRTDCYLAIMKKMKDQYPDGIFEVITRTKNHILSPSKKLLSQAKNEFWTFEKYSEHFIEEMKSTDAKAELKRLREIAKTKVLFLVCYEKNPEECHRSLVKKLIIKEED